MKADDATPKAACSGLLTRQTENGLARPVAPTSVRTGDPLVALAGPEPGTRAVAIIEIFLLKRVAESERAATIAWEGDSWEVLKSWPKTIRLNLVLRYVKCSSGGPREWMSGRCSPSGMASSS